MEFNKERIFGILSLLMIIVIIIQYNVNLSKPTEEETFQGWIQISNRIGQAGAGIYLADKDPNLPENLQFSEQPQPQKNINIITLSQFINLIEANHLKNVYKQDSTLILILNSSTWYSYTPQFYPSSWKIGLFN
jgi:hypothetical protein